MKPPKRIASASKKWLAANPDLARAGRTVRSSSPILRSSSPSKGSTPRRKAKPRAVNPKRRKSEFARTYFSKARVAFVKSLPCVVCTGITSGLSVGHGASDNAHTGERSGMSRKAGYDTIVPMCRSHHERFDRYGEPFNLEECREAIQALAPKIEALWAAHLARVGGGT